ncbi:hypothetical protein RsS62_44300 [Rhizobium dioscoreae]|nr:hypothetical protein RsS62_44300 [Rhizobium dioscoreae]
MRRAIDADDLGKQRRHFRPIAEKVADRPGDLGSRKQSGRNLIEEWLKEVMIAPIDHRDADGGTLQIVGELYPAKTTSDHNNMMILHMATPRD